MEKTDQELILDHLRRSKWNWLGHTIIRYDSTAKQALQ